MSLREVFFIVAVLALVLVLAWMGVKAVLRNRGSSNSSWGALLGRLVEIDRMALQEVALDLVDKTGVPRTDEERGTLNSDQVWNLLGGLEGLERIQPNCGVVFDRRSYFHLVC